MARTSWERIAGHSPALQKAMYLARRAAASKATVLLYGETGTGKELFARAIHDASDRGDGPFVAVNCAALTDTLVESTLFGYAPGAFTGANRVGRPGVFEQAHRGSVLLDEIGEMPVEIQPKLLRVVEEREVVRVSGERAVPIDVRILSSTNRDLQHAVSRGRFRAELFYRLNVFDIPLPTLRERREDIPGLVTTMLEEIAAEEGRRPPTVDAAVMESLLAHDWPGNVRELRNCLSRAVILASGDVLRSHHFPPHIVACGQPASMTSAPVDAAQVAGTLTEYLARVEQAYIGQTLRSCNGNRRQAAEALGISVTTLWRRLQKEDPEPPNLSVQ